MPRWHDRIGLRLRRLRKDRSVARHVFRSARKRGRSVRRCRSDRWSPRTREWVRILHSRGFFFLVAVWEREQSHSYQRPESAFGVQSKGEGPAALTVIITHALARECRSRRFPARSTRSPASHSKVAVWTSRLLLRPGSSSSSSSQILRSVDNNLASFLIAGRRRGE